MPRPLRIEYEDACYHVMNRGRGRQHIFHKNEYFAAFLHTLSEAQQERIPWAIKESRYLVEIEEVIK